MSDPTAGQSSEEYLAVKEAGVIFGYTADYVAKLCRDGLVNARRDGRGWFVEKRSLADFVAKIALEEKKRLEKLSAMRASEYRVNREFIPLKEASTRFGYTADYVAKLCRDGSVNAIRIGREWSVELASLEQFSERTARGEAERLAALRETRATEYAAVVPAPVVEQKKKRHPFAWLLLLLLWWEKIPFSSFLYPLLASFAVCLIAFALTYTGALSRIPFGKLSLFFSGGSSVTQNQNQNASASSTPAVVNNNYTTYNNTYQNTYNTYKNEVAAGVSTNDLNLAIQGAKNSVLSQVYGLVSNLDHGVSGNTQSIQLMNAPNSNFASVNISNSTFTGGTITGASANLTGLSVSGSTQLSSLTTSGDTNIGGTLSVNGPAIAPYFTATSSSATSTFAGAIALTGSNNYLNFGDTTGSNGYGIRDNGGLLEFKNNNGSWAGLGTGGSSGGGTWSTTTSSVSGETVNYSTFSTDVVAIGGSSTTSAPYWFDPNALMAHFSGNLGIGGTLAANTLTLGNALGITYGGTGTSTAPGYGQLLIGNAGGGYDLVATSSLGITSAAWGNITGSLSAQTDLQNALDAKLNLSDWYATTTDGLLEGTTNLYFTPARAQVALAGLYVESAHILVSADTFRQRHRSCIRHDHAKHMERAEYVQRDFFNKRLLDERDDDKPVRDRHRIEDPPNRCERAGDASHCRLRPLI